MNCKKSRATLLVGCDNAPGSAQGLKKRDEKLDSRAAEKGAKKLVCSDCVKILDQESSH
jgi:hypothetical protein